MTHRSVTRFGGLCLAGGAVAFLGVFTYLAARFNYPDVLDGPAATVLPSLLATGSQGRAVWAIYALLPLIWLPAGVAAYEALAPVRRATMRLALLFAMLAALTMMLGLMRWPSIHWHLALAFERAAQSRPCSPPSSTASTPIWATTSASFSASSPSAPSSC